MLWKFFKTHWFSIALILIVLLALVRKNLGNIIGGTKNSKAKAEKYTDLAALHDTKSLLGILGSSGLNAQALPNIQETDAIQFIKRFSKLAQAEQKKFGVPASVMLSLAYVNSYAGSRTPATQANNFFALPCTTQWDGAMTQLEGHCFRKYNTPWESFRDFSIFLAGQDWLGPLRKSAGGDYKSWINGMIGVSDVPNARSELLRVIETYQLYQFDKP